MTFVALKSRAWWGNFFLPYDKMAAVENGAQTMFGFGCFGHSTGDGYW
jgi:hypothetical protein